MRPTYLRLFNFEFMIEPVSYSSFSYIKESATESELHLGKVRVLISKAAPSSNKMVFERFN
jgi:hypothetical protein